MATADVFAAEVDPDHSDVQILASVQVLASGP
jgi:hypothetical protein